MTSADCVFCRIVAGDEPSAIVATNESSVAFLTIQPATRGHTLVVPRQHARNLFDIPHGDLTAVLLTSQEIAVRQRDRLGAEGVSLFQANEIAGFQSRLPLPRPRRAALRQRRRDARLARHSGHVDG